MLACSYHIVVLKLGLVRLSIQIPQLAQNLMALPAVRQVGHGIKHSIVLLHKYKVRTITELADMTSPLLPRN
jgi:hypothetical protein